MKTEKTAIIIATKKQIRVYKSKLRPTWINAHDFETEYNPKDLSFLN